MHCAGQRHDPGTQIVFAADHGVADAGVAEVIRQWTPSARNQGRVYPLDSMRVDTTASPGGTGSYPAI